ncbi:nicotinate-nucleotide diphosphorylase (carboxylating), partial [Neorhizobium sp. SHOUNA12B]|nr:nicotinate-nucleotide diphosphorylase (carboxylating) [Neorhizobium sp. SHOUNA12B]
ITPATAAAVAASGVDLLSVGWITHSAPTLDIGLDFRSAN